MQRTAFLSAAFLFFIPSFSTIAAASTEQEPSPHVQPLIAELTPVFKLPGLGELRLDIPVHVTGWRPPRPDPTAMRPAFEGVAQICTALAEAAREHNVPLLFFARLIWFESGFNRLAVSRVGAQGVAQFMPSVAAERGLDDPFDPIKALPASARLLSELHERFGNWGLAAAAYNAGPRRIREWLSQNGGLPRETRRYVVSITGMTAEQWTELTPKTVEFRLPGRAPCRNLPVAEIHAFASGIPMPRPRPGSPGEVVPAPAIATASLRELRFTEPETAAVMLVGASAAPVVAKAVPTRVASLRQAAAPPVKDVEAAKPVRRQANKQMNKPWAVQLAAHWSRASAFAGFERLRRQHPKILAEFQPLAVSGRRLGGRGAARTEVRIALETRGKAETLCSRLRAAGGACLVLRN